MDHATFVTDLAMVLGVAAITSLAARLLRQPPILGYLFAGLIVGPNLPLPLFADTARVGALAEFGVILVMFAVGLEFRIRRLLSVLPTSGLTGLFQVSFLLWCGFSLGQLLGWTRIESVFLGAGLCISSTMVVSGVLARADPAPDVRRHVFGVLVVQDVLAIVLIAVTTAIAAGGGLGAADLLSTLGRLAAVLLGLTVGGLLVVPRLVRMVVGLRDTELLVMISLALCFGLALLAELLGYSVALGAFLAGVLVAESGRAGRVGRLLQPLRDVFAAVFFVSIGMTVDPRLAWQYLPVALLATIMVVVAQMGSVTVAGLITGLGLRRSLTSGLALGQIGEFAFILAAIGVQAGIVGPALQPVLVTVAVLTTFTTPHLLGRAERLVTRVDAALPRRVRQTLGLYEAWIERFRELRADPSARTPLRRSLRAVALDALMLLVLAVLGAAWMPELAALTAEHTGLEPDQASTLDVVLAALLALPVLIGLLRNTLVLARLLSSSVSDDDGQPHRGSTLAARSAYAIVVLAVVLAVGMPSIAVLRPLVGHAYGMLILLALVAGLGVYLWRTASAMAPEYRSGAEAVADFLARQGGDDEDDEAGGHDQAPRRRSPPLDVEGLDLLPGLDSVHRFEVHEGQRAVGSSLSDLDLRALTGATVLVIQRPDGRVLLPTGSERLRVGDLLGLVGTTTAVDAAVDQLTEPAEPDAEADVLAEPDDEAAELVEPDAELERP